MDPVVLPKMFNRPLAPGGSTIRKPFFYVYVYLHRREQRALQLQVKSLFKTRIFHASHLVSCCFNCLRSFRSISLF